LSNQIDNKRITTPLAPAAPAARTPLRLAAAAAALLLTTMCAGPVLAQTSQPGTEAPAPSVPSENGPRAQAPQQGEAEPGIMGEEEDDEGGEGCPYLGTPLELTV
jgi:hypothetical protein